MAYRCLDTWTFGGQTVSLTKVNDYSFITQAIQDQTISDYTRLFQTNTLPSYIIQGDAVYTYDSDADITLEFLKDDNIGIYFGKYNRGITYWGAIFYNYLNTQNQVINNWGNNRGSTKPRYYYLGIIVDDDNQRAYILFYSQYSSINPSISGGVITWKYAGTDLLYQYLSGLVTYNWQSVPSISGKNGISLELAHHLDVNDGEPITTEDTTKFSRKWINNVGRIIETKLNE